MSKWYEDFINQMKKIQAIEDMPKEDVDSGFNLDDMQSFMPTNDITLPDVNKPLVFENKHYIKLPGAEFIVELVPQIVSDPSAGLGGNSGMQGGNNPNEALLNQTEGGDPYQAEDKDTEDPITKKQEKEKTVKVHKKEASFNPAEDFREYATGQKDSDKKEKKDEEKKEFPKPYGDGIDKKENERPDEKSVKDDPRDMSGDGGLGYMSHRPGGK